MTEIRIRIGGWMEGWGRQGKEAKEGEEGKEGKEISMARDKERYREGDGMRRGRILQRSTPT